MTAEIQDRLNKVVGKKYHRLTVLRIGVSYKNKAGALVHRVICQCECGNVKEVGLSGLKSGNVKSCGCLLIEHLKTKAHKHGLSRSSSIYKLLRVMIDRCYYVKSDSYKDYGGRGITICSEWLKDFMSFYNWCNSNGYKKGLQINRINNDGNYEPSNCNFITPKENSRNRRSNRFITYNGKTLCVSEWAEITGINKTTILVRLNKGLELTQVFLKDGRTNGRSKLKLSVPQK